VRPVRGRHASLAFTRGVRTAAGVVVGRTSARGMARRYRRAGFVARAARDPMFGGTFVTVRRRRGGPQVAGGFALRGEPIGVLGVPRVPVCD
jgi:hypothetical protein